jgi:OPT family small oligopeptide transporter
MDPEKVGSTVAQAPASPPAVDKIQSDIKKLQKSHQWDPNLPQEKADEITAALETGELETIAEVQKDFATKSPYEDVRAAVREIDNEEYANTFRAWFIGLLFVTAVSGVNMFLSMRSPAITIPAVVVILVTYPVGVLCAKILPTHKFNIFGLEWTLNPGPFSIKEHAVITLMAKITADYPYSTNALEALQAPSLYNHNMGWGFALLFTLSSQMIGIAMSGMFRRFLVWPSAMIWPGQFATTSLLYTIHDKSKASAEDANGWKLSRYRWFCYLALASFLYYWLPGVLWQGLSVFAFICWIKPDNVIVNQLFGGVTGLSLLPITFDWTYNSSYLQNPLLSPWHSHFNCLIGLGIFVIIPTIGMAYTGTLFSDYLPINTSRTFDNTGARYNVSRILSPDFTFDEQAYREYSPMFLAPTFFLNYGLSFATLMAALVHTGLNHWQEIWYRFRAASEQEPDVHMTMMKKYKDAPDWWYGCVWVGAMAMGLATVLGYDSQLPWWGFLVSCIIAFVFIIPLAMIYGMTNILISLNILSPFIGGFLIPGRPIANMLFKVYSTIVLGQAQVFSGDLKFAHYMKVPPRTTFFCQISAAIWSAFVQISVMVSPVLPSERFCLLTPLLILELGARKYPKHLRSGPSQQLHMPQRKHVFQLEYCLGRYWTSKISRRRQFVRVYPLLLAARGLATRGFFLRCTQIPQNSRSIPTCSRHARLHGLATTGNTAELLDVGNCRFDVQPLDSPSMEGVVDEIQLHHGSWP